MIESVNLKVIKDEIVASKKARRMTNYIGEVFVHLATREVRRSPLLQKNQDEHIGEILLRSVEKFNMGIKTKGRLITKGFDPRQVLQYLKSMVYFAAREHQSFTWDKDKRIIKQSAGEVYIEEIEGFDIIDPDAHFFDEAMDYQEAMDIELEYVI